MKSKRQEKILELIEKYNIETQEELIARLAECGIESKQTTVSRDIKELYLYKEPIGGGRSRYAVSGKADHIDNTKRLKLILSECSVGVDYAGIVVLLKTLPGLADAAGAAIDAMKLPDMLGCISGQRRRGDRCPRRAGGRAPVRRAAPVLQVNERDEIERGQGGGAIRPPCST